METKALSGNNLDRLFANAEENRFGLIFVVLTVVGCLGGIAVGAGAVGSTMALISVVLPTMLTLSLLLAVSPMRLILTVGSIATVIDIILITYYSLV